MRIGTGLFIVAVCLLGAASQASHAQLSLTENSSTEWTATNGTITAVFNPSSSGGEIYQIFLNAYPSDNLVDTTQTGGDGNPKGLYMDNDGTCMSSGIGSSSTPTATYHLDSGHYLDWSMTWAASSSCPFTIALHYMLFPTLAGTGNESSCVEYRCLGREFQAGFVVISGPQPPQCTEADAMNNHAGLPSGTSPR